MHFVLSISKAAFCAAVICLVAFRAYADAYDDYNAFCLANFGAEKEALTYEMFGSTLQFIVSGDWVRESRNSAALGFQTNLPAKTYVEYGTSTSYGQTTATPDRYYALHLHYLKGLHPDAVYHYRLAAIDERGNKIFSSDRTLRTKSFSDAVLIPGGIAGPPYVLDKANTTYLVTEDITANTRAFSIKAAGVVLDLNGHTVVYDNSEPLIENAAWNEYAYSDVSSSGVHVFIWNNPQGIKVFNGIIRQGAHNGQGNISIGFNPFYAVGGEIEAAGLTVEYSGHSVGGMMNHWGVFDAHHNVIIDRGTGIDNRHMGIKALSAQTAGPQGIHHNLIKRARHQGILPGGLVHTNEIYLDSFDTNSFGIKPVTEVYKNRIFGTGYHVVAVGWGSDITVRDNFVNLQGVAPTNRSDEYGSQCSVNGFRLTQYGGATENYENNLYYGNTIVVKGRDGCGTMRGVQFSSDPYVRNLVFRQNTIKTFVQGENTGLAPCVVAHGLHGRNHEQLPIIYRDNVFMSNSVLVRFGDDYASGGNHYFLGNKLIKLGEESRFRTLQVGYWIQDTYGNLFMDTELEGGARLDDAVFSGSGKRDYTVGHSLYIHAQDSTGRALVNQYLEVWDSTGKAYRVQTDNFGSAKLEFIEYTYQANAGQTQATKISRTGHRLVSSGYRPLTVSSELMAIRNSVGNAQVVVFTKENEPPSAPLNLRFK
jgi:hypothetical protein